MAPYGKNHINQHGKGSVIFKFDLIFDDIPQIFDELKGALNLNFLNLTVNKEKFWL